MADDLTILGEARLWQLIDWDYDLAESGLATLLLFYETDGIASYDSQFQFGAPSGDPDLDGEYNWCVQISFKAKKKGSLTSVVVTLQGFSPGVSDNMGEASMNGTASTEPIDTNPAFHDAIVSGDTPIKLEPDNGRVIWYFPRTGAMFDYTTLEFIGFTTYKGILPTDTAGIAALTSTDLAPYAGVRSYLCPGFTLDRKFVIEPGSVSVDFLTAFGRVLTPDQITIQFPWLPDPNSWLPSAPNGQPGQGRNLLNNLLSIKAIGNGNGGFLIDVGLLCSGSRGFQTTNDLPYKAAI